jgi:NADPH:quinone reductase
MTDLPTTFRQLRSRVDESGTVELALAEVTRQEPADDQVLVRVEAAPINPSDLGLLLAGADPRTAEQGGTPDAPVITARLPEGAVAHLAARVGSALPAGNEGAGTVVAAGPSAEAQALLGRTVALFGGAMYAEYRLARAAECLALPDGTTAVEGASCFVNPLTALGMVETMRREGHTALAHTAAASNLGQMLVRICQADGVPLVNIVRRPEQVELLRSLGAEHVCDSSSPTFPDELTAALGATGATIAFDAIGGGELASRILAAMEAAASASSTEFNRYGTAVHKQVYIYGGLDRSPTTIRRTFGMAWGVGGWLLPHFLAAVGPEVAERLRQRVASEVTTTFASHYARQVSLTEALDVEQLRAYGRQATGEKYLIRPSSS